jgi:chromosome segregation ATPase
VSEEDRDNKINVWANFRNNYYESISAYNSVVNSLGEKIQNLNDENSNLHKEVLKAEELLAQNQNIQDQIEQLKKDKEKAEKELETKNDVLKEENDKAREAIKKLEDQITKLKEEEDKKTKELEDRIAKANEEVARYEKIDDETTDLIEKINEKLGNITRWNGKARAINQTRIAFYQNVAQAARELELAAKKFDTNGEKFEEFDHQKLDQIQARLNLLEKVNSISTNQGFPIFQDNGDFNDQNLSGIIDLLQTNADINQLIRLLDQKIIETLEEVKGNEVVLRRTVSDQTTKVSLEIVWENFEKLLT